MGKVFAASAAIVALALTVCTTGGALAQDKKKEAPKAVIKVVAENDKVRVTEITYAPGAENSAVNRATLRVTRALAGGTLQRTYADGKKQTVTYKTGEVHINEPGPSYTTKNIGKKEMKLYSVQIK